MSGLSGSPSRYCPLVPSLGSGSLTRQVSASHNLVKIGEKMAFHCLKRYGLMTFNYLPHPWRMCVL